MSETGPEGVDGKIVESGQTDEHRKSGEFELSPELELQIMDKVMDIDANGTAYTFLSSVEQDERLANIMSNGLLGVNAERGNPNRLPREDLRNVNKEKWAEDMRKGKPMPVYVNIVGQNMESLIGRDINWKPFSSTEMSSSYHLSELAIVFDIGKYTKATPGYDYEKQERKTYRADSEDSSLATSKFPRTEYGYLVANRVSPRYFRGIVFGSNMYRDSSTGAYYFSKNVDRDKMINRAQELARIEIDNTRKIELIIPIYDIHGNLWWPKQMSYEEVKQFIAERDAQKEEK